MEGLDASGLNIVHEALDRHARGARADKVAFRFVTADNATQSRTFSEMHRLTNQFANVLANLGVNEGERVFTVLGRAEELYVTALGALKNRNVYSPLFASFGPDPLCDRLRQGRARVLVTTPALYRKVAPLRNTLPELEHVLLTRRDHEVPGTRSFDVELHGASESFTVARTDARQHALLHYTSGTTGTPKGALHVHEAVVAHHATARIALDLHPDDIFWCTADPGWVTGTSYGIIAPLTHGVTTIVDEDGYDAARWYRILEEQKVSVWYTAPTALRLLMRAGAELPRGHDLSHLRLISCVGEPVSPGVVAWTEQTFGVPVHDNWWQTETGAIMIANLAGTEIRPGSMGRPMPGIDVALLEQGPDGRARVEGDSVHILAEPEATGELALRSGWPSMFSGYDNEDELYAKSFVDGWYLTGDVVHRDTDGWFWFVGRSDDVIKSAGHLIGPVEVEAVLCEHPAVSDAAVIGVVDPVAGEVVKAFIQLRSEVEPSEALRLDILGFARRRLGTSMAPRLVTFESELPTTQNGKITRKALRLRERQRSGKATEDR